MSRIIQPLLPAEESELPTADGRPNGDGDNWRGFENCPSPLLDHPIATGARAAAHSKRNSEISGLEQYLVPAETPLFVKPWLGDSRG